MGKSFRDLANSLSSVPAPRDYRGEIEAGRHAENAEADQKMIDLTAEIRDLTTDVRDLTRSIRRLTWSAVVIAGGAFLAAVATIVIAIAEA